MITATTAKEIILNTATGFGTEIVSLHKAMNRVLAEDIYTDRPLPPFDRVTKDGIAINFDALASGENSLPIVTVIAAGQPQFTLEYSHTCVEIMTGAVLPIGTDTVVMYEDVSIKNNVATFLKPDKKGINIHYKGSDRPVDSLVLSKNTLITGKEMGVLASVGNDTVLVKKTPSVAIITTGNELVDVYQNPKPHQIRKSNSYSLLGALDKLQIIPEIHHINDDVDELTTQLKSLINTKDVLLISGGVSKGKYDFIPTVLENLGVAQLFHRVLQQPGKPLWFGVNKKTNTVVFSFPGNPVSTYVNFYIYFVNWLQKSLALTTKVSTIVKVNNRVVAHQTLTRYLLVTISNKDGILYANVIGNNGSGDLVSLAMADGIIVVPENTDLTPNDLVEYISF